MPPTVDSTARPEFSLAEARGIVKDLFSPSPLIYWSDFLLSLVVGGFCFVATRPGGWLAGAILDALNLQGPAPRWALLGLLFTCSVLGIYRAVLFTHELVHLRAGGVKGFWTTWNVLCGIPFLIPSFLYETHVHHHMRKHYATHDDGEYLPLASGPARNIFWYLAQSFVLPILAVLRFAVVTPLTWISPRLRDLAHRRASSMVVDPNYLRPLPTVRERRTWRLQEAGCFVIIWAVIAQLALGVLPWAMVPRAYALSVCVIMLNAIRTLAAHRYRFKNQGEVTFVEQLLDSVNYPRRPLLSELWAPVGLRYHALHHLFPSLPYHNLGRAHRRLMEQLPADSPYRQTNSSGLVASLSQLWREARESSRAELPRREAAGAPS